MNHKLLLAQLKEASARKYVPTAIHKQHPHCSLTQSAPYKLNLPVLNSYKNTADVPTNNNIFHCYTYSTKSQ